MDKRTTKPRNQEEAEKFAAIAQQASVLPFLTEEQAAVLFQTSMKNLQRLRADNKIPFFVLNKRDIRYDRVKLTAALMANQG